MISASSHLPYGASPPAHWKVSPLKYLSTLSNGFAFKSDSWEDAGTPILRIENLNGSNRFNYSTLALDERYKVTSGDLLYSWSGNPGTSFGPFRWARDGAYYLNQHIFKVSVHGCDTGWLYWSLRAATHWIERELTSGMIGMVHVTKDELGRVPIPLPPPEEQRRIADFLDAETARIDGLLNAQNRLQERLSERRTAGVTSAVADTERNNRRSSTLSWLETLPADWKEVRVGLLARMGSGHTPSRSHPEWWTECSIPWITTGEVKQVRDDRREDLFETREKISELGLANSAAELHPAGTVVLCRTASAGYSAVMGTAMATSQDFVTWTCGPQLDPYYLLWCLRAMRADLLGRLAMGSTHKTIYVPDLQMLRIPLPPLADQRKIVKRIRQQNAGIDRLSDAVRRQSSLLTERRQALITAAVTGQIDVSTASRRGIEE
ncbi:restriction endonuclease subunit S [Streptomyces purpurascens]|uniref:restriction endonuclease subunit S n=1 Tax=Streptomyces purpurascens TaxID=1924 RepID=UPI0016761990|nr:restriction endonuclease subunit S [Streptomyces purpurascens]MCE7049403.1 restriction endonuclease subunit S [Streptomyces purpurascens]GHA21371.1 type I restriction enzyme EcoEI specificity protein [Streptomyces purpurascens]